MDGSCDHGATSMPGTGSDGGRTTRSKGPCAAISAGGEDRGAREDGDLEDRARGARDFGPPNEHSGSGGIGEVEKRVAFTREVEPKDADGVVLLRERDRAIDVVSDRREGVLGGLDD